MKKIVLMFIFVFSIFSIDIDAINYKDYTNVDGYYCYSTSCAKLENGKLSLYGNNSYGRFGVDINTKTIDKENPVVVNDSLPANTKIIDYSISPSNVYVVTNKYQVYGAGRNHYSQLGYVDNKNYDSFVINRILTKHKVRYAGKGEIYDAEGDMSLYFSDNENFIIFTNYYYDWIIFDAHTPKFYSVQGSPNTYSDSGPFEYYEYWIKTNKLKESTYATEADQEKAKKKGWYKGGYSLNKKYSQDGKLTYYSRHQHYNNRNGSKKYSKWTEMRTINTKKYKNGKMYYHQRYVRNTKDKLAKDELYQVKSNGTISYVKKHYKFKANQKTKKTLYTYVSNKQGKFRSNSKYGNSYRYKTTYVKGKAKKTVRQKYSSKGKLSKKVVRVKLRK